MIYGTMRVDELLIPIESIALGPGCFILTGMMHGPQEKASGNIRIYDAEGNAVTDMLPGETTYGTIPALGPHDQAVFRYKLKMDYVQGSNKGFKVSDKRF